MINYEEISIPDEVNEKINNLSVRLDLTKLNKNQWNRIDSLLTSLHLYIDIYKEEIIKGDQMKLEEITLEHFQDYVFDNLEKEINFQLPKDIT